jgi:hypothetical protein
MILLVEKNRHSIMDAVREIVGGGDDQRGARNRLARRRVCPAIPKASNRQHFATSGAYEIRLFGFLDGVPFIIAGRRNEAARAFEGRTKHRLFGNRLGPRVECRGDFPGSLFPPARNEAPTH